MMGDYCQNLESMWIIGNGCCVSSRDAYSHGVEINITCNNNTKICRVNTVKWGEVGQVEKASLQRARSTSRIPIAIPSGQTEPATWQADVNESLAEGRSKT
jgi:hypothetical protein